MKSILNVKYNGKDISEDISKSLLSFSYNDNEQGSVDDIEIVLENKNKNWTTNYYPDKGSSLEVSLKLYNWYKLGSLSVYFGKFVIDELSADSNGTFTIKAIASSCERAFKNDKKMKTWENVTLRDIASQIASSNNLQLNWKPGAGQVFKCIYQIEQTDAEFLFDKCNRDAGFKLKIADEKLIIYEDTIGDSGLKLKPNELLSWNFKSRSFSLYSKAEIKYINPKNNELVTYTCEDNKVKNGNTLYINEAAENEELASMQAKSALKRANEREITASITLIGNPNIWTGYTITLEDFGVFDGTYLIDSVKHTKDNSSGYVTSFEAHLM